MADPIADTLEKAVETAVSGGAIGSWIEMVLARRPFWIAQAAAEAFLKQSASTAPLWRWVRLPGPLYSVGARGTSMAATVSGAGGLAVTLGIPIVVAIGVWV